MTAGMDAVRAVQELMDRPLSRGQIAALLREEADFWLGTPGGNNPNSPAYMIGPLLLRLADQFEATR